MKLKKYFILILFSTLSNLGCKKIIEIPPPIGTITNAQVFATDNQATSAAASMYYNLINTDRGFSNYGMTFFGGLSADELSLFDQTNTDYTQFQNNSLLSSNGPLYDDLWTNPYFAIYTSNAIISGLTSGTSGVHAPVKTELIGEAEFVRAFCHFYLTNMYGNVPLVTTINWQKTNLLSSTAQSEIYAAIISDLKDAQTKLSNDYSLGNGQRIIPNKWVAMALLARVYLYQKQWSEAEQEASAIINNSSLFKLESNLNNVFLYSSGEAIWQLQQDNNGNTYNATPEGYQFIPFDSTTQPFIYLTDNLLKSFEPGDQRKLAWVDSTFYNGTNYYYPYKYKLGPLQATPKGNYTEYQMVFRLAEQYLIRAEAEANGAGSGLSGAINDLNVVRRRAGLPDYSGSATDKDSILSAIYHERRIELFAEWGHRWFDLKRTGQANTILSANKGTNVNQNSLLFPLPVNELRTDPNLNQNPGY